MTGWRYVKRTINGKRRRVKTKYFPSSGRTLVRVCKHKNYSDKAAR
jgi:hypothetical protein